MNWFLMLWPMTAAASLTLALMHFWRWLGQRDERANLLFSVAATATAGVALCELMIARADTTVQYATLVRWAFLPLWFLVVSLVLFVRMFFGTGRTWLALASVGLWTLTVIVNFLPGQNLVYTTLTRLRPVDLVGGGTAVVGEGVANPWNAVNYLGTLLMLAFVADASRTLWRQGGRRRAAMVGGSVVFFFLVAGVHSALIEAGLIESPYIISFSFLAIVVAMSAELNRDLLRAAQVSRQLQQSQAELRESEQRLDLAAESAGAGLWSLDLHTKSYWVTKRVREMFGFASDETVTADRFSSLVHPEDRERVRQTEEMIVQSKGEGDSEYRILKSDGSLRWMASRGRVRCDAAGNARYLMGVTLDITERKLAEADARRHLQELAHLSRISTVGELSTSLAHELNQPLGAILRNAEAAELLLQADVLDLEELRATVADIRKDDERAGNVIDGLRALVKRQEFELQPVALGRLVSDVVALVSSDATARRIQLGIEIPPRLPAVWGDPVHLQQVLLNLLMNGMDAMNHSQNGDRGVVIRARLSGERQIEVAVSDSGAGIPPDTIGRLFEPFFTTKARGMGMGLPISRTIIEQHHGRIWAVNNATRGATFHFTLTTAPGDHAG